MSERSIFLSALDITDCGEREVYLDQACGRDSGLRRHIEELIAAEAKVGGFLARPHADVERTDDYAPVAERPGSQIGPYKLMEQIGEGGFGLVFVAEQQQPVRRKVALKVIKPGMDTREVIARFEAERQALALMDHPNIARVLEAGTTNSGRPYFVMELVRGVPITEYCDANQLTPQKRLELFVNVCQAVQHAHQKGVIHRDLKPSNILVAPHDGVPVVKVIDFGVAKALGQQLTDKTIYTRFAQMIGTPLYMSPEQAEINALDVDTRSDVYALGVLLYELLTGTTPFDKKRLASAAFDEIRRIIREEEPESVSMRLARSGSKMWSAEFGMRSGSKASLFRRIFSPQSAIRIPQLLELDWIVMKALEKDRTRRYETASAFAADVGRYLRDEQVTACPPSLSYRMSKFTRRYRAPLSIAAGFIALLLAGVAASAWQAVRATNAEKVAVENERGALKAVEAEKIAKQAEANQRRLAEASEQVAQQQRDVATKAQQSAIQEKNSALAAREEQRETLYAAEMNLVQSAWEGKQYTRAKQLLEEQPADLRGFEWHYWQRKLHPTWLRSVEVSLKGSSYTGWNLTRSSGRQAARWALLVGYPGERESSTGPRLLTMFDGVTGSELLAPFDPFADQQAAGIRKRRHLTISDDASRLAVALMNDSLDNDNRPGAISIRGGGAVSEIRRLEIPGLIRDAVLSPDGSRIAVEYGSLTDARATTGQTEITIWDASTGELVQTLPMLPWTWRQSRILWSPDGERLLRQSVLTETVNERERYRELIQIVDVATGEERCKREFTNLAYSYYAWSWSPDGKLLAIFDNAESGAAARHNVELWDADTGSTLAILDQTAERAIDSKIAFSPDGQLLAVACDANEIHVSEVPQPPLAAGESTIHLTAPRRTLFSDRYIFGVAFSADGRELHALRTASIVTWDATAREDAGIGPETITEYFDARFSADATKVGFDSGSYHPDAEGRLHSVWDLEKNQEACRLKTEGRITGNPVFSPDGRYVALFRHATRTPDPSVRLGEPQIVIYDAQTGDEVRSIPVAPTGSQFSPHDVQPVFRPGGGQIAALISPPRTDLEPVPMGQKRLAAWELPTGKQLFSIAVNASDTDLPEYSRDGASLVLATNDRPQAAAVFFDASTGERQRSISLPTSERSFSITNDQQMFVSRGRSESDAVFGDLATGQERLRLPGYGGSGGFAISPDGSRLVLATSPPSGPRELTLWSFKSGRRLLALQHPGGVRALAFSPDGNRLLAAVATTRTAIHPIQIWDATPLPEEP